MTRKKLYVAVVVVTLICQMLRVPVVAADVSSGVTETGGTAWAGDLKADSEVTNLNLNLELKSAGIDLSLTVEQAQAGEIVELFFPDPENIVFEDTVVYDADAVKQFIPLGSEVCEVVRSGRIFHVCYIYNGISYSIAYDVDGSIEKIACETLSDEDGNFVGMSEVLYVVNSKSNVCKVRDCANGSKVFYEFSTATQQWEIQDTASNTMVNRSGEEVAAVNASATIVDVLPYTEDSSTAPYVAQIVEMGRVTIEALADLGHNTSRSYWIHESMTAHEKVTTKYFDVMEAGTSLQEVAKILCAKYVDVKSWFTLIGVVDTVSELLEEACKVVETSKYSYMGGREVTIYDPTVHNKHVEVYEEWGEGIITFGWDYEPGEVYKDPQWVHTGLSYAFEIPKEDYVAEAQYIYNGRILLYGYWNGGVGELGY